MRAGEVLSKNLEGPARHSWKHKGPNHTPLPASSLGIGIKSERDRLIAIHDAALLRTGSESPIRTPRLSYNQILIKWKVEKRLRAELKEHRLIMIRKGPEAIRTPYDLTADQLAANAALGYGKPRHMEMSLLSNAQKRIALDFMAVFRDLDAVATHTRIPKPHLGHFLNENRRIAVAVEALRLMKEGAPQNEMVMGLDHSFSSISKWIAWYRANEPKIREWTEFYPAYATAAAKPRE